MLLGRPSTMTTTGGPTPSLKGWITSNWRKIEDDIGMRDIAEDLDAPFTSGTVRWRVRFRLGGGEGRQLYAGSFETRREAVARRTWVMGELAAMRVPDLRLLAEPVQTLTFREAAQRWQASRVDVREATTIQHRSAVNRVLPFLGMTPVDEITITAVADVVAAMHAAGSARETIRKSVTAIAMTLDFAGISPNPARNRVHVRLPRAEPDEVEPPIADAVEAVARLLAPAYRFALAVLDATGVG